MFSAPRAFADLPSRREELDARFNAGGPLREDREHFFGTLADKPEIAADFAALWELAAEATEREGCAVDRFHKHMSLAGVYLRRGDLARAETHWRGAAELCTEHEAWEEFYPAALKMFTSAVERPPDDCSPDFRARLTKMLRSFAGDLRLALVRSQGALDAEALNVDQGFFGCSDHRRIGSHSIADCLCVALRHRDSRKTIVAHIDDNVAAESMEALFRHFPPGALEARLLGVDSEDSDSRMKLDAFLLMLAEREVTLVSADVLTAGTPRCWVIDPATFAAEAHVPGVEGPHAWLAAPLAWGSAADKPLGMAFDLCAGIVSEPIRLRREQAGYLICEFFNKDFLAGAKARAADTEWCHASPLFWFEGVERTKEAIEAAVQPLIGALQDAARTRIGGIDRLPEQLLTDAWVDLYTAPKFIGEGAAARNQALVTAVREKYLVIENGVPRLAADCLENPV